MWAHPGKKLLFMGGEWGERQEWQHEGTLDWGLLQDPAHAGIAQWVADLNHCLRASPALYQRDVDAGGFEWVAVDATSSVLSFLRHGHAGAASMLVVINLTPVPRAAYRVGVPQPGCWTERLNSDASCYGGSGLGNLGALATEPVAAHGHAQSLALLLPPLSALYLEAP
jgi:1,4-alpha-glucan branching enzyme